MEDNMKQKTEEVINTDGGVFSARLEALICSALQDGMLTEQEKSILKKRVEKEGEDWDEVEMIINSRLAEMHANPETKQNKTVAIEKPVVVQQPLPDVKYEIIPEGLEVIRSEYESFEFVKFPSSVKQIEDWALGGCDKLKALDFSQCTQLEEISNYAFSNSNNLKSIILPPSLKKIGEFAFNECSSLKTLDFSQCQLEEIGEASFSKCVFESMIFPPTLKKINPYAFQICNSLKTLDFSQCTQLEEIGDYAFSKSNNLNSIILPPSLKKIGKYAFNECSSLKTLDFSQCTQLEEIGDYAFYDSGLESIILPPALKEITFGDFREYSLFIGCDSLKTLDFSQCTQLEEIDETAFEDSSSNLKSVILPPSLKKIGILAFKNCSSLKTLDFSQCTQLEVIGERAFEDSSIEEIVLPDSVEEIGDFAFSGCERLKRIVLSSSLKTIGERILSDCNRLNEIDFSRCKELKVVGQSAFENVKVKKINLPDCVTTIETRAFYCNDIKHIVMPASLETLENNVFSYSNHKITIDFSKVSKLQVIPSEFCSANELTIPQGVTTIEEKAFTPDRWEDDTRLFLPPSLKKIEGDESTGDSGKYKEVYIFAPLVEGLFENISGTLYVLPEYIKEYEDYCNAMDYDRSIKPMPDEYLYYYDN